MRKRLILLSFLFFIGLGFLFVKNSEAAYDCNNRSPVGYDSNTSASCNPQDTKYSQCKNSPTYSDCTLVSGSGCRFFADSGSLTAYCAYTSGSTPAPKYNCGNRDPKCPVSTHDCFEWNYGSGSCSGSGRCYSIDSVGKSWCAYPKGSAPTPPVAECKKEGGSCFGTFGSPGQGCCDGLICDNPGVGGSIGTGICKISTVTNPDCNIVGGCNKDGTYKLKCRNDPKNLNTSSCDTAIGNIKTTPGGFINDLFVKILGIVGGLAVLLIIISGYKLMASQGNPEKVQGAKEQLTAAIIGLLFVAFSIVILQVIGYDILKLPGFSG